MSNEIESQTYNQILAELEDNPDELGIVELEGRVLDTVLMPIAQQVLERFEFVLDDDGIDGFTWSKEETTIGEKDYAFGRRVMATVYKEAILDDGYAETYKGWMSAEFDIRVERRSKYRKNKYDFVTHLHSRVDWHLPLWSRNEVDTFVYGWRDFRKMVLDESIAGLDEHASKLREVFIRGVLRKLTTLDFEDEQRRGFINRVEEILTNKEWEVLERHPYEIALEYTGDTGQGIRHGAVFSIVVDWNSRHITSETLDMRDVRSTILRRYARPIHPDKFNGLGGFCSGGYGGEAANVLERGGEEEIENAAWLCRFSVAQFHGIHWPDPTYKVRRQKEREHRRKLEEQEEERRQHLQERARQQAAERLAQLADSINVTQEEIEQMLDVLERSAQEARRIAREEARQ